MLQTVLCDAVGIDVPVIQAGMSVYTSPRLASAVSNAGGLGSLGAWQRPVDTLRRDLEELRSATDRAFAVNHVVPDLDEEAFALTLEMAPAVVSFALDDARDLFARVHDAGSLAMQQITTVAQAVAAVEHGADIVVAQGAESGGYGGAVSSLALLPQVVEAIRPTPVVAAGGIADGRGLAAALVLGAAGVNVGTRFLACEESPISDTWKKAIVTNPSESWVQLDFLNDLSPNPGLTGYGTRVRALRTEFTDRWETRRNEIRTDPSPLLAELASADDESSIVVGGQSAGLVDDIERAADVVREFAEGAEHALAAARSLVR